MPLTGSQVTDFTETPKLFTTSISSPPIHALAGGDGRQPTVIQYNKTWIIRNNGSYDIIEDGGKAGIPKFPAKRKIWTNWIKKSRADVENYELIGR